MRTIIFQEPHDVKEIVELRMRIDERILRDITERLNGKEISAAKALAPAVKMRKLSHL